MHPDALFEGPAVGHAHGIVTVVCLVALVGAIWKFATTPNRRRVAAGVILGVAGLVVVGLLTFRGGDSGEPVLYMLYAGCSVAALTILCGRKPLTIILSVVLLVVFLGLSYDYGRLVRTADFIGDPNAPENAYPKGGIYVLIDARDFAANCPTEVPAGFLSDAYKSGAWDPGPASVNPHFALVNDDFDLEKAHVRWYTYVTGIWRLETQACGIWTSGGNLSKIAADIELRER